MKNLEFHSLLKQAFSFSWRNKRLWWLGFFAGGGEIIYNVTSRSNAQTAGVGTIAGYALLTIIAVLAICLLYFVLNAWGRAGLLLGIRQEKQGSPYEIKALFGSGAKKIWRLILVDLIMLAPAAVLAIPILVYLAWPNNILLTILFALVALVLLAYFVVRAFAKHYVYCFAVLEDEKAWPAIKSGWNLFRNNIGALSLTGLIQVVLRVIAGIAVLIVVIIVALPFILLGVVLTMFF
ncbi:MAG: hypothetical protein V1763_02975, partial [Parcubacteria group bacterium]